MMSSGTLFPRTIIQISAALMLLLITGAPRQTHAQRGRGFTPPENVATRGVTFWSEGTRLAGDLYYPKDMNEDSNLPAIVLCHGWGGTKSGLRRLGSEFAAAGYVVLAFDYRGWGASDGKVVVKGELPKERTEVTVLVQVIREVVDPFDQLWDIRHAIDFIETEPGVDADRIGIWGSSYGGGLVVWTAAHDERVKCVASQVGAQDSRSLGNAEARDSMHQRALQRARGEIDPVPQGLDDAPGLRGTPHRSKMSYFGPVEFAEQITVPVLFVDAENEELFDRHEHSEAVYNRMKAAGKAPTKYHVIEGIRHYGVYSTHYAEATRIELEWYDEHLKGGSSQ